MFRVSRESAHLCQATLGDLAGISQAKVSKIEVATPKAVCSALDLEMILIPRRISGDVQGTVDRHLNRTTAVLEMSSLSRMGGLGSSVAIALPEPGV